MADNAYSGAYPMARFLYVYINKAPGKALDPLTREFVKMIVSKEGQEVVIKDGYFPHPGLHRERRIVQDTVVAINAGAFEAGGPGAPAHYSLGVSRARTSRRILLDRWASRLVVVGGIVIIACILAILFVIAAEVYPLFKAPTSTYIGSYGTAGAGRQPAPGDAVGVDEYREVAYVLTAGGRVDFFALKGGESAPAMPVPGLDGATVTAVAALGKTGFLLGTSDGRSVPLDMKFDVTFKDGKRTVTAAPVFGAATELDPDKKRPVQRLASGGSNAGGVTVAQVGPTELVIQSVIERKALIGGTQREESRQSFVPEIPGEITALKLDSRAEDLFIGTSQGQVLRYDVKDPGAPKLVEALGRDEQAGQPRHGAGLSAR